MGLPRLEIHTQSGLLNIRTQNAKLEGTPPGLKLSMRGNSMARIKVTSTAPRIRIDQTRSWESAGIEKPLRNLEKYHARCNQKCIDQIGMIARKGVEMMRIERGGGGDTAIQRIAARTGYKDARLTIKNVAPPDIGAQMGRVDIQDVSQRVRTEWREEEDTSRYIRGSVTVTWGVRPSIEITVVPGTELPYIGQDVGTRLDQAI